MIDLLYSRLEPTIKPFSAYPLVAVDTETTLFPPTVWGAGGRARIAPFGVPDLIIGSFALSSRVEVHSRASSISTIRALLLDPLIHLVFHHCAFDIPVFEKADPSLVPLFTSAVQANRIHDTKLLETLLQIARGSRTVSAKALILYPTLKDLAARRAGMHLNKSDAVRMNFGQFLADQSAIPPGFLEYAAEDAEATYKVFVSQWSEAQIFAALTYCDMPRLPDAESRWGLLSEGVQVKAALAFHWLERFPVRLDLAHVESLRKRLQAESDRFQLALVRYGWGRIRPKKRTFHLIRKQICFILGAFAEKKGFSVPRTAIKQDISLKYEDWNGHVTSIDPEKFHKPDLVPEEDVEGRVQVWLRYMRVRKLLAAFIYPYSSAERHYPCYKVIGARTTRISCEKINITQAPKRRDGIRAAFIPEDQHVFIERDFHAAELVALAELYHLLFGGSVLEDALNSGTDPHEAQARRFVPSYDQLPEADRVRLRQAAKALNFGLPGGLGPRTLGVYARAYVPGGWSEEKACEFRTLALAHDPELARYLAGSDPDILERAALAARNLGITAECLIDSLEAWQNPETKEKVNPRIFERRLSEWRAKTWKPANLLLPPGFNPRFDLFKSHVASPIGFVRGNCSYTEGHNTPFQALVAAGAKLALWNLYVLWRRDPFFQPVAFIHDSILIQTPLDRYNEADLLLNEAMVSGLAQCCPHIKVSTKREECAHDRWGPDTNPFGDPLKKEAIA